MEFERRKMVSSLLVVFLYVVISSYQVLIFIAVGVHNFRFPIALTRRLSMGIVSHVANESCIEVLVWNTEFHIPVSQKLHDP